MLSLKQATAQAKILSDTHGEPWLVFITPADAPANHGIASIYNKGRFAVCRASEKADYEAGGAMFPTIPQEFI